jgi:Lrp/AsnC family transcriptional regulator, leucine-responsive regulatory protein
MTKLDILDQKILVALDKNSRQSSSRLAKKLHTSQQVISYRMKKLIESGVISSFITTFSSISLGLSVVKIYIQYTGMTQKTENDIYDFLSHHKYVNWISKTIGKYDLFAAVMVKDIANLGEFKTELFQKFGKYINSYSTSIIQKAYTFPRSYIPPKKEEMIKPALIHKELKFKLDDKDKLLLKNLANDSRITVLELAKRLNLNIKTVMSKIKNLRKGGIIQSFRININRNKIGLKYYKVFIKLRSYDPIDYEKLKNYCLARKYLVHLIECIGEYELELEMEMVDSQRIEETIRDIRNKYSDIVANIESCEMTDEMKLTWLPQEF